MENTSMIGYKTFASQFSDTSKEGNGGSSFQRKAVAIKNNKLQLLHAMGVDSNFSFSQKKQNDLTLLHYAAYFNSPSSALYLLYQRSDINALDKQGKSVFHLCSYTGHVDVLIYVIEFWKIMKIRDLNEKFLKILSKIGFKRTDSKAGKLKTQVSSERQQKYIKGQNQIAQLYRQYRGQYTQFILKVYELPDINYNRNCFHYAALNKYQKCLTTLEYMIKSLHNQDLVLTHELLMHLNEVSLLVKDFTDPRQLEDVLSTVQDFIRPETLKQIVTEEHDKIKNGVNRILSAKDKDSHNAIYLASKTGSASIVALLKKLDAKYSLGKVQNPLNDDIIKIALNNSARSQIIDLCEASKKADVQIMNFLISCGQEINKKKSIFGTFALLQAVRAFQKQKNLEPIKVLLKSGADVNQQDSNGWTIFHHIAQKGHTQILKLIFQERQQKRITKLAINKLSNKGYHMLHIAAMHDQTAIIQTMLNPQIVKKHDIDVNPFDEQKATILHHAAKKGCLKTMKKILQLKGKALIGFKDVNDNTCLHLAASNNHTQCVRQIILFDSDYDSLIKLKNKKGKLAKDLTLKKKCFDSIFTAARQGDVNMIRNLVNQNHQLIDSSTPVKNRTPLILSVIQMQLVNVKFLVESKADQYHEDAQGKTASQYAQQLQQLYSKKDKTKIPLLKKIRSLLD